MFRHVLKCAKSSQISLKDFESPRDVTLKDELCYKNKKADWRHVLRGICAHTFGGNSAKLVQSNQAFVSYVASEWKVTKRSDGSP